jgi:RHS repeat-associated protein
MSRGGATYYLAYDPVGSLRIVSDASGAVVKRVDYDSFGNILADSNPSFTLPFGFAGGLHDPATGLVRFGYRDYDPDVGRWTAKDPILFAGGDTDLFGYVQNDPVNIIDPFGLKPPANIPPGVDVEQNVKEAQDMSPVEFYDAVKSGGKWDYKQQGSQYEDFGNYNFGMTGSAVGFSEGMLKRGAGAYQIYSGTSSPQWGWPWGSPPYGDDPNDQRWIDEGVKDFERRKDSSCQ